MAILKQIKFGNDIHQIAKTQVAVDSTNGSSALSVSSAHTEASDANDPVYTLSLALDGKTIVTNNSSQLETALALKVEAASGEGPSAKKARIALVDSKGGDGYAELSSVDIEDIVGEGIVDTATYDPTTGKLTIAWVGSGSNTEIDLGALLDIQDIVIKSDSTDFLSFSAIDPGTETGGQAQIGVKLADVTYTAASGGNSANLTVDTTNGKVLDASDAIPAIKNYVDAQTTDLAVTAEGDNYITAAQDASNNKKINVTADVQALTATAGTVGTYAADGSVTTAPVAGSLSGTADSLADGADIASKVKTYVDGAIAIEAARSDAKNKADIAALDVTDTAVAGQYVSAVNETDGKVSMTRANVSDAVLNGYAKGEKPASTALAATDDVKGALAKLEHQIDDAKAAATTKVEKDAAASHLTLTSATAADGSVTYTVGESDIASKTDLDAEIAARKAVDGQNGQTYAANANANYISNATSLNDADVKLDAAIKANADAIAALDFADTAVEGQVVTEVDETNGVIAPTRANLSGITLAGFTADTSATGDIAATDTVAAALNKLQNKANAVQYKVDGTTLEFFGMTPYA